MIQPKSLAPGDKIAITCPAGAITDGEQTAAVEYLRSRGYVVEVGETVGSHYHRFAADDGQRRTELQKYMDDPDVAAILCGRGGYGTMRIIEGLDFEGFALRPKWLIGFSDITCLHSYFGDRAAVMTLHGHMLRGFSPEEMDPQSTQYLMDILEGRRPSYYWTDESHQQMTVTAPIVGGNLALLSDLCGTTADIDTQQKILIVEDVGEYYYNVDRMMMQLRLAGKLDGLKALIYGAFTDMQDNEVPFGERIRDIMHRVTRDYDFPVVGGLPFGHQRQNWPILLGADYRLTIDGEDRRLELLDAESLG